MLKTRFFHHVANGLLAAGCVAAITQVGCGDKKKAATTPKDTTIDAAVPRVDPTLCDTEGKNIITADLNKDGRPDVWRMLRSEEEGGAKVEFMTCKQVDFDHDGRKDWVVGYNRKGAVTFERADFDYDGKFDMSAIYDTKTATVAEVERDSDFDGKFDLKETYDSVGQLVSVKRDRNGDGAPDMWEQYKDGILLAILYDDDFDNKVDRREEIPGARPKVEMPTATENDASGSITDKPAAPAAPPAAPGSGK
ncbi:MAG: hypothetical protein KBG15_05615 [Kofleriaceae bacterium]|nr:hypothetical protein [Kofleriaceae bacterium]